MARLNYDRVINTTQNISTPLLLTTLSPFLFATTMEEEEEDAEFLTCVMLVQNNLAAGAALAADDRKIDHRMLPRGERTEFDHML